MVKPLAICTEQAEAIIKDIEMALAPVRKFAAAYSQLLPLDDFGRIDEGRMFQLILAGSSPEANERERNAAHMACVYFGLQVAEVPVHLDNLCSMFLQERTKDAAPAVRAAARSHFYPNGKKSALEGSLAERLEGEALRDWVESMGLLDSVSHNLPPAVHSKLITAKSATFWISLAGPYDREAKIGAEDSLVLHFLEGLHLQSPRTAKLLTDLVLAISD